MARTRKVPEVSAEPPPGEAPGAQTPVTPPVAGAWRRWIVHLVMPLLGGACLLAGVLLLGGRALDQLRQEGKHTIAFADIECDPPQNMTRQEFLEEVQYLANLPDQLNLLEPNVNARIIAGLSSHPWVAEVKRLESLPPRRVTVELVYRVPVLAVAGLERTVDQDGILLPRTAQRKELPVLRGRVAPPVGGPGHPWGDDLVRGAAAVAGLLRSHLQTLKLNNCTIVLEGGNLVLATPRTRVIWGRAPGQERANEPPAEQKIQRLLARPALAGQEHDLRPSGGVQRRVFVP